MRSVGAPPLVCLAVALAGPAGAGPAIGTDGAERVPAVTGDPMAAVWKEQRVVFHYAGRTAQFSCDGLRDKVRAMLLDLGARRDVKIVPRECRDGDRSPARTGGPRLNIVFSSPALPDAAARPLSEGDLAATDARFERFTITNDAFRNMGIGDCELVREFARQLLPKLSVRDVRRDIVCVPYQPGSSRFFVRGEILKSLPSGELPGGGRSGGGRSAECSSRRTFN